MIGILLGSIASSDAMDETFGSSDQRRSGSLLNGKKEKERGRGRRERESEKKLKCMMIV